MQHFNFFEKDEGVFTFRKSMGPEGSYHEEACEDKRERIWIVRFSAKMNHLKHAKTKQPSFPWGPPPFKFAWL